MGDTLGALLDDARRRAFVGREEELASFEGALTGRDEHRVLFVHGPGGIGKTTLLQRYRALAAAHNRDVVEFDGRDHTVTDDAIAELVAAHSRAQRPPVLLIDGYDLLEPLDDALRLHILPAFPADAVTVLAGRQPPSPAWRTDAGWRRMMVVHELAPFDIGESTELLARAGVPADRHAHLLALGRGHPLALALLAQAAVIGRVPDGIADVPNVVDALLPIFVDNVPGTVHARALEVCAHAWVTTPSLLEYVLGDDASLAWRWLESLPFVVQYPLGLYPHDLARDVLEAEHRRRSPDSQRRAHHLLHAYAKQHVRVLAPGTAADVHVAALQLLYLHKDSPLTASLWQLREREAVSVLPGRVTDHDPVVDMIARAEGDAEATLARRWLASQPEALHVLRRQREMAAFAFEPVLPYDGALEADDGVVRAVLDAITRRAALRPGERVSVGRFFGGQGGYQTAPLAVVCGAVGSLTTWLTRPLAWSWIVTVAGEFWAQIADYLGFDERLDIPGDIARVAFGFDWRRMDVETWLDVMGARELSGETGPMPRSMLRPPPLGRDAFERAVRDALRNLHQPADLSDNPLCGSRLVRAGGAAGEELAQVVRCVMQGLDTEGEPGDHYRVLDRTFLRRAPSQEAAAEVLDLSFSTYRRRLARAVDVLVDHLWAIEIGERDVATAPRAE